MFIMELLESGGTPLSDATTVRVYPEVCQTQRRVWKRHTGIPSYSQQSDSCFSYSFSVKLVSNFQLSSGRVDGEGAALVTVRDGVPHVTV